MNKVKVSKGYRALTEIVSTDGDVVIRATEVNRVEAVLSSAEISFRKVNLFAPWISYYVWKVPKGSQSKFTRAFGPVRVCGGEIYTAQLAITGNRQICLPVEIQKMLEDSGKIRIQILGG